MAAPGPHFWGKVGVVVWNRVRVLTGLHFWEVGKELDLILDLVRPKLGRIQAIFTQTVFPKKNSPMGTLTSGLIYEYFIMVQCSLLLEDDL